MPAHHNDSAGLLLHADMVETHAVVVKSKFQGAQIASCGSRKHVTWLTCDRICDLGFFHPLYFVHYLDSSTFGSLSQQWPPWSTTRGARKGM